MIPDFIEDCAKKFIAPRLASFSSVSITFDLWMSRGSQDIFDLITDGMDETFRQHQVHLRMVECNATTGTALADVLREQLDKQGLTNKVVACVQDGGSNLNTCMRALQDIVSCDILGLHSCFEGRCFAHVLSGACNAALAPETSEGLNLVHFKSVKAGLQKCITWTKKSGNGKSECYKSCRQMNMKERLMPTPVKTRFVSTIVMLKMMLAYPQVVEHCFSNQSSPELRTKVPSTEAWEITCVVVSALEPIMESCILFQRKEGWLIRDAVDTFGKLCLHYHQMLDQRMSDSEVENEYLLEVPAGANLDVQLKVYQRKIAIALIDPLEPMIKPLMEYRDLESTFLHHYLSLALVPRYKELKNPFMTLHARNTHAGRQLARRYDENVILSLLAKLKGVNIIETRDKMISNNTKTQTQQRLSGQPNNLIECFTTEAELPHQKERTLLLNELVSYRREPFDSEKDKDRFGYQQTRKGTPQLSFLQNIYFLSLQPKLTTKESLVWREGLNHQCEVAYPQRILTNLFASHGTIPMLQLPREAIMFTGKASKISAIN